ncbi:MAG TPA: hypothetical protein DCM23_00130 [Firmicutes bacterium]|nr:hypothetical protein [Bacillota bacterium]
MKKKLILLPLLMLALGACGSSMVASSTPSTTSATTTSTVTTSTTTSETTSEAPVVDTNVYRIVGTVQETAWTADGDDFVFVKDAEENIFTVEGIDLFINDEWAITLNGDWPGQLGFSGATNLTIVDTETTHGEGGGYSVKNFKTLTDGNYDIELNTGVAPRVLTITRVGDPVNVPVVEEDPGEWHLVGNITGTTEETQWVVADATFALVYSEVTESYKGTFEFEANAEFKVISSDHSGWDYARGPANVETDDPAPEWLDLTGGNIKILTAGTYDIEFFWVASVGATINGVITIVEHDIFALPEGYTKIAAIKAEATIDKVYKTRGVVIGLNGGSIMFQDPEGEFLNTYSSAIAATLYLGDHIDVEGTFSLFNSMPQLGSPTVTILETEPVAPVEPRVLADGAELTARMATTDWNLSGEYVRLNGVTTTAPASNKYNLTFDGVVIEGYTGFSELHNADSTGRDAVTARITDLAAAEVSFDISGALKASYSTSTSSYYWSLSVTSVNQIISDYVAPLPALTLAAGATIVIYNSSQDLVTTIPETGWYGYAYPSIPNWNGDDAVALLKADAVIDLIGVIGVDPGSSWTGTCANAFAGSTANQTLVRTDATTAPNATFTWGEWDGFANKIDSLGSHTMTGTATDLIISEYTEGATGSNKYLEIYNGTGAEVSLEGYTIILYSNGSLTATQTLDLATMTHVAVAV